MLERKNTLLIVVAAFVGGAACLGMSPKNEHQQGKEAAKSDKWTAWRPLIGTWKGTTEGEPGKGKITLKVSFVLNEQFLKFAGTADYKGGSKGAEHHEDFGYVSFDKGRKKYVFRQFHTEGFVNQYTQTSDPENAGEIVLTSESCENTPPGWKARETYSVDGDKMKHTFELAAPGKPFERYSTATLERKRK